MPAGYQQDVEDVQSISAVPTILDIVCRSTGMGFAAVARVTGERWIACAVRDEIQFGLEPGGELKVDTTICHEIKTSREPIVIDDVLASPEYCGHKTPKMYGFRSYISVPILLPDGQFFGTLCAIDPKPARLANPQVTGMFKLFAELIGYHLEATKRAALTASDLLDVRKELAEERDTAALREEFVAILGHDLRNPIAAIQAGISLVQRTPLNARAAKLMALMYQSAARMTELVDNMLDFTRGRLGGGIGLNRIPDAPLRDTLELVVSELRTAWPDRVIETHFSLTVPVDCDPDRIDQLCSNLLSNALTHGAPAQPIRVEATSSDGGFELSVTNGGAPIPDEAVPHLFKPFSRGKIRSNQQGLGLGLHIAAEIARAHDGQMSVTSSTRETRFTFRMPIHANPTWRQ